MPWQQSATWSASAAACALGWPPPWQSAKVYSDWRTGLLYDTRELSTNVTVRTPHPSSVRATAQPRVPAPEEGLQSSHCYSDDVTAQCVHMPDSSSSLQPIMLAAVPAVFTSPGHMLQCHVLI
jgi:hypothetical protein